jgi:hypothetical protein
MARKKDLGGLAALAGLAYMASRDKEGKGPAPSAPAAAPSADTGGDFIEAGSGPTGDFMSEKEPGWESGTAPSRKPAATRPAGGIENARDELLKRQARPRDPRDAELGMSRGTRRVSLSSGGMKKGGSVKGWGIARGSRKAKTY